MKKIILLTLIALNCAKHPRYSYDYFVLCIQSRTSKKTGKSETIKWVTKQINCTNSSNGEFVDLLLDYRYLHDEKEIQEALKEATHSDG